MQNSICASLSLIILLLLTAGCEHHNEQIYSEDFEPYVDEFFFQANKRGVKLDPTHFDFRIRFGSLSNAGGICNFLNDNITINKETWDNIDEREREILIFHELGHCILKRKHRNERNERGEALSYMHSNGYAYVINPVSDFWREYYCDELFNEQTQFPEEYINAFSFESITSTYTDTLLALSNLDFVADIDSIDFELLDEYLFNVEFEEPASQETSRLKLGNLLFTCCLNCTPSSSRLFLDQYEIYKTDAIQPEQMTTMTIYKRNDIVSLYINRNIIHVMEASLLQGSDLRVYGDDMHKINVSLFASN